MGVALQSLHTTVDKIVAVVVRMDTNSDLASLEPPLPTMAADRDVSRINS
jgi:hypothetical protein